MNLKFIISIGILALAALSGHSAKLRWWLFCSGVISVGAGYRSVHLGYWSHVVPLECIVWILWLVLIARGDTRLRRSTPPMMLVLPLAWAVLRAVAWFLSTGIWDEVLAWTLPFVLGSPMFAVTGILVSGLAELRAVIRLLIGVSFGMSVFALLEYWVPGMHGRLPWLFTGPQLVAQDGFVRAPFSYFGYPAAAAIVTWGAVIAYDALLRSRDSRDRLVLGIVFSTDLMAVYASGQRSSWFALAVALLVIGFRNGIRGQALTAVATLVLMANASGAFWTRTRTITDLARTGSTGDTSANARIERFRAAWTTVREHPVIGSGYAQSLAHNVPLEIGRTLGIFPALVFTFWLFAVVLRIAHMLLRNARREARDYGYLFLALAVLWVVQFAIETVLSTPALAAPHWLLICVTWHAPAILARERLRARLRLPAVRSLPPVEAACVA